MRLPRQLFLIIFITLISFNASYGQDLNPILKCNVAELKDKVVPYLACHFEGQDEDTDTRDYTIEAEVGDTITWQGESESGNDAIFIRKIKLSQGTNIFGKDFIDGVETVTGVIKHNTKNKPDYKYTIHFKINNSGKMYKIDPKVKVGSGD